jgi:hypothetical protein
VSSILTVSIYLMSFVCSIKGILEGENMSYERPDWEEYQEEEDALGCYRGECEFCERKNNCKASGLGD